MAGDVLQTPIHSIHPTTFFMKAIFLISRQCGGEEFCATPGEDFMSRCPHRVRSPRDITRAIDAEIKRPVPLCFLDITHRSPEFLGAVPTYL
jgi:aspartate oxidase